MRKHKDGDAEKASTRKFTLADLSQVRWTRVERSVVAREGVHIVHTKQGPKYYDVWVSVNGNTWVTDKAGGWRLVRR